MAGDRGNDVFRAPGQGGGCARPHISAVSDIGLWVRLRDMRTRLTGQALPVSQREIKMNKMNQHDRQTHWMATENVARFQALMDTETDTCQRKLLEGLIVLEKEKLKKIDLADR